MFLVSNNQLSTGDLSKFGQWLAVNVHIGSLCRLQSWTAKALLTPLLHGVVEMDAVAILRDAHLGGASLESPSSLGFNNTLLQVALIHGSVQCARYLIDAGADVSVVHCMEKSIIKDNYCYAPLGLASRSKQCVDLIPGLLAHGASPIGMHLLKDCISSGASYETIESLIDAGVSPDERGGVAKGASLGRCDIIELLLSAGACVDGIYPPHVLGWRIGIEEYVQSPAIAAASSNCTEAIEVLIRHNVNLNASLLDKADEQDRTHVLDRSTVNKWIPTGKTERFHPIQAAVDTGNCEFVEYLLGKGASVTPRYGSPLLVIAAQQANTAMIRLLLVRGANVNSLSESGPAISALEAAAGRGFLPGMKLLIEAGAYLDLCSSRRGSRTPLQRAAESGESRAVNLLLESGADINAPHCPVDGISSLEALIHCQEIGLIVRALAANASVSPSSGATGSPLLMAVAAKSPDIVGLLIRLGADFSRPAIPNCFVDEGVLLPLQLAAELGLMEVCKILVEAGADIDGVVSVEDEGWNDMTPLAHACNAGEEAVARYLISENACLTGESSSYVDTPFYQALCNQELEVVHLLLQKGLNPNDFCGHFGSNNACSNQNENPTPLMVVFESLDGCTDGEEALELAYNLVELLIQCGADTNRRLSLSFNTPLQLACMVGDCKLAKLILSHDAEVNAPCPITVDQPVTFLHWGGITAGVNALQAAVLACNMEMVSLLLSKGATVQQPAGFTGRITALQAAVQAGDVLIAEKLLKAGAQVDEPPIGSKGRTSLQAAAELGRLEMLGLLLANYKGTQSASEICDEAIEFVQHEKHDHLVGYLREYKQQHSQAPVAETQSVWELDDLVNWDGNPSI